MTDTRPRTSHALPAGLLGPAALGAPSALTDTQLLERVREGEVGCYAELYLRHVDAAQRQARRAGALEDPEDVAQEAFVKILRAVQDGGGPRDGFVAYLMRVVRNEAIDRLRRDRETAVADLEEESLHAPLVEDGAGERAERELVTRALGSLSHDHQELLWSTEVEGRSPRDLAPDLHVSANVVAQRASRAREALRTAWLQEQVDVTSGEEDCRRVATLLGAFARGRLGARRAAEVEEHLASCPRCTGALAELDALSDRMRSVLLPVVLASPLLLERVASRSPERVVPLTRPVPLHVLGGAGSRCALASAGATVVLAAVVTKTVLFPWTGQGEETQDDHIAVTSAPVHPVPRVTAADGTSTTGGTAADPADSATDPTTEGAGTAGTAPDGPATDGSTSGTPAPPADGAAVTVDSPADGAAGGAVTAPVVAPQQPTDGSASAPGAGDGTSRAADGTPGSADGPGPARTAHQPAGHGGAGHGDTARRRAASRAAGREPQGRHRDRRLRPARRS